MRTKWDYEPEHKWAISFQKGEIIEVVEQTAEDEGK